MKSIFPLSYRHVTTLNKGNNSQNTQFMNLRTWFNYRHVNKQVTWNILLQKKIK